MPGIKDRVIAGRLAVDAYRIAHSHLYDKGWYKGISEDHTPLLEKLVADLEALGISSTELEFEPRKAEILKKLWDASDLLNVEGLGFVDKDDFKSKATETDRESLDGKWR